MNRLRFTKVRQVTTPSRGNDGDAGLDFYIPVDLTYDQLSAANKNDDIWFHSVPDSDHILNEYSYILRHPRHVICAVNKEKFITTLFLSPMARVLIPSGIRVLMEPKESMLTAANKSGLASKNGVIYTAQIVDSPYTGEIHLGICNLGDTMAIKVNQKVAQFIHVPIYLTTPEEISNEDYDKLSLGWGTRGNGGFGSTGI